ncbi:MFS transporter [Subtercola sp. Z020]|uniref:MFS transporter n=1 Tax=Subtercola sp. Z020 TaxID=2080582 RepID=UPI000CE77C1E|nr:MFS transporter [Subtercola sp. Z020]PPF89519.1 MFS transporter [Subtercola sp. Z020]
MASTTKTPGAKRTNVRWQIAILAGVGVAITNIDRSTISVALPYMSQDLHISPLVQGLVLGWFFLAYAIFLLPIGVLVDRIGSRLVYGVGAIVWGVATLATAAVNGVGALVALRFLLGLGEATQYPSCIKATAEWFPRRERSSATATWDIGARVGGVITLPLVAGIIAWAGWRVAFLITGALALVWAIGWLAEYRRPGDHRRVNAAELAHIASDTVSATKTRVGEAVRDVKWRELFRRRSTWGLMIGYFCFNYVAYFFITWFPSYLVSARGFSLLTLGIFGAIPGIFAVLTELTSGFLQDRFIRRGWSTNRVRKGFIVVGMLVSSLIAFAAFTPSAAAALVLLTISYGALLIGGPSLGTFPAEFAPSERHVGSLAGIQNFAGNLAGFLGPIVTGAIVATTGSFVVALVLAGAIAIAGAVNYLVIVPKIAEHVSDEPTVPVLN